MSGAETSRPGVDAVTPGRVDIHHGENLVVIAGFADASFTLIYIDPPFNTGRTRTAAPLGAVADAAATAATARPANSSRSPSADRSSRSPREQRRDDRVADGRTLVAEAFSRGSGDAGEAGRRGAETQRGFRGHGYARLRDEVPVYGDAFDDYCAFLRPRLIEAWRLLAADGTLYVHVDYREAHYVKVMMDALFGRERFLNELIWAYDYGAKSRRRWPSKHDTILVYVKDVKAYWFDSAAVDRIPYMAPGLVTPEKAARGKLPTDVWWHTIVPTSGPERTGYPTQKPEGLLRRIVQASSRPGDRVLDFFAGSGTTGAVAATLGRDAVLVDANPDAVAVMRRRIPHACVIDHGA